MRFRLISYLLTILALTTHCGIGVAQRSVMKKFSSIGFDGQVCVVNCFTQDSMRMIWIGTNHGLYSYDGYNTYHHYNHDDPGTLSQINCMLSVGDSIIVGSDNGLMIFDIRRNAFVDVSGKYPTDIRALTIRKGSLWIGSLNGLYELELSTRTLRRVSDGLGNNTVYSILNIEEDGMYIGTYNGLYKYINHEKRFRQIPIPVTHSKSNIFVNSMLFDPKRNCVWIGTEGNLYKMNIFNHGITCVDGFGNNSIKSLALDRDNAVIIGTDNGLYTYDSSSIVRYSHDSRINSTISNNIVWSVFIDANNNLWVGTDYNISVSYCSRINTIPISEITKRGDGNIFYSILKDSHGLMWLGGTNGIIQYDSTNNSTQWYTMDSPTHKLPHNRIRDIYQDCGGDLWIATDGSINRYDYEGKKFLRYNIISANRRFNANWAYNIFEDQRHNVWVGSFLGGVFVTNRDRLLSGARDVVADHHISFGDTKNFVNQMIPASDGGAWVLLYKGGGLYKIDGNTFKAKRLNVEKTVGETPSLILTDNLSRLWCACKDKIAIFTSEGDCVKNFKISEYSSCDIISMRQVKDKVWLSTVEGVWVIDKTSFKTERLNIARRTFYCIYYDETSNKVILGGPDEITEVNPDSVVGCRNEADIQITAIYVNDAPYSPKGCGVTFANRIDLGHDQNHIIVRVSDFNYSTDNKSQFIYNIKELGDDWMSVPVNSNQISYANLTHGTYTLRVKSLNIDGKPSAKECSITISIAPPWYDSTTAHIIYALCMLGLVTWTINFFRVKNRLRIARIEKEKTVEQIALKTELFTNISHELKTPLSMIIAPIGKLLSEINDTQVSKSLNMAYENALKMNALIHKVLDAKRIDADTETLMILSQVDMVAFCKNIVDTFETAYQQKHFVFNSATDSIFMDIDVVKVESIINNLISNACKYSGNGATIAIAIDKIDDKAIIKVSDDGIGIAKEDIPFIFQRLYQSSKAKGVREGTGIGLYLAKKFVELHDGSISVSSNDGNGTTFTVILPIKATSRDGNSCDESLNSTESDKKGTILIVEDNSAIRQFLTDTLGNEYKCITAENGKAGLAVCGSVIPDLMIIDYMMPLMNGIDMCRKIKQNPALACVPIIILTAKDDSDIELRSTELGVDCFMPKPFNVQVLTSRIRQLLGNKDRLRKKMRIEEITAVSEIEAESSDEKLIAETVKLIEDHIDDPELNVNYLCENLGIGSKQLYRKIKQHIGVSPVEFIKQVRLKKAAMLIQQNKFTISEIMYMVGFSSSSYFAKCFQAHYGMTPRQYLDEKSKQNPL